MQVCSNQTQILGGEAERLYPYNQSITSSPMCLLPIANRPLLYYSLAWLEKNGMKKAIVVVQKQQYRAVSKYLKETYTGSIEVDLEQVEDGIDSAQALLSIEQKLVTDTLVISGDLITNLPLQQLVNFHRKNNPLTTFVLSKKKQEKNSKDVVQDGLLVTDYIGFDAKNKNIIKYFNTSSDLKKDLKLNLNFMKRASNMIITTNFQNSYMFIFSRKAIDCLVDNNFLSLTHELLPHIIKTQKNQFCYAFITNSYAQRAYTLISYQNISREIAKEEVEDYLPENFKTDYKITTDSLIGSNNSFGDKVEIRKNSIVGSNCTIGNNVKIFNSIIMNKVTIGDNCTIHSTIIGNGAKIKNNITLQGCTVSSLKEVEEPEEREYKNEVLC